MEGVEGKGIWIGALYRMSCGKRMNLLLGDA